MKKFVFKIIVVCGVLMIFLTGCSNPDSQTINDKLDSELQYVEDLIFKIAIKQAKEEYLEDDKINWNYIKGDIQKINETWNNLILDLTEIHVQNDKILEFSNDLNNTLVAISQESEIGMLDSLNNMYIRVIGFKESYVDNRNIIEKNKIRSNVLSIYVSSVKNDYTTANSTMLVTLETYKSLINNDSYADENGYNLNKIYILLEEYNNALQTQNQDIVRMKYILTVEEL